MNANSKPSIEISHYIDPQEDRSTLPSVLMPTSILTDKEIELIRKKAKESELLKMVASEAKAHVKNIKRTPPSEMRKVLIGIDETLRGYLPLRDTDRIATAKSQYTRRTYLEET